MSELPPIPQCVIDKILKLNALVEQYPESVPVSAAADFLGMDGRSLKAYLMEPQSCGLGWRKDEAQNRGFKIPTAKFYLWYRNLVGKEILT